MRFSYLNSIYANILRECWIRDESNSRILAKLKWIYSIRIPPNFQTAMYYFAGVTYTVSKLVYNVQFSLNRLIAAVLLKNGVYYMYVHLPVYTKDIWLGPLFALPIYMNGMSLLSDARPCQIRAHYPPPCRPVRNPARGGYQVGPSKRSARVYHSIYGNNILSSDYWI